MGTLNTRQETSIPSLPFVKVELKQGETVIHFDPQRPPRVFFDTNVILGLGQNGEEALKRIKYERGFRYRFSMLNFVELASHLTYASTEECKDPFRKYQTAFRRLDRIFSGVLPSAESILMRGIGLGNHTGKNWIVDSEEISYQVKSIAEARSLEDVLRIGIKPDHYRKLRAIDGQSFVDIMAIARETIEDVLRDTVEGSRFLLRFYAFLVYRASSQAIRLQHLPAEQNLRVIEFFNGPGGKMFISHLMRVVLKALRDGAKDDANDFYDMMQLLLLTDTNLLFVTNDRVFFQYYMGAEHHRVAPWKGFKES